MKKNIITIAGDLGSGKSTTADIVARILNFERFSSGSLMRAMAEERGVDIVDMNKLAETDESIDHEIDTTLQNIGEQDDNLVIDSRTAWHWIPSSFKVYLTLDHSIAATRIFNHIQESSGRDKTEIAHSVEEVRTKVKERSKSEQKRFIERYGINPRDTKQFDVVIDTEHIGPQAVADKLIEEYKKWRYA